MIRREVPWASLDPKIEGSIPSRPTYKSPLTMRVLAFAGPGTFTLRYHTLAKAPALPSTQPVLAGYGYRSTTDSATCGATIGSAWRWMIRQAPSSGRNTVVTRRLTWRVSGDPPTRAVKRSISTV